MKVNTFADELNESRNGKIIKDSDFELEKHM